MDIGKEHEDFCKVFKPKYGTIFNIDTVQFESLDDCFYDDAKMLNWAFGGWLAAKQQAVPDGFVVVESEMSWQRADELSMSEWGKVKGLFLSQNRDLTAIQVEEFGLRWARNKAHALMRDYKAMIQEAQK